MKFVAKLQRLAAALATVVLVVPSPVSAGTQPRVATAPARLTDVALQAQGTLHGQVLDADGQAQAGIVVHVQQFDRSVATATTDAEGRFVVAGLRGGVYQVTTITGGEAVRLWAPHTAPPSAQPTVILTSQTDLVRAQGGVFQALTNPWVLGLGVAAAIAIPLAINNNDDAS